MPRCALEAGGQDIYIYYDNNKIGVVQRGLNLENTFEGNLMHMLMLMDPTLSFGKTPR